MGGPVTVLAVEDEKRLAVGLRTGLDAGSPTTAPAPTEGHGSAS
jgi:hypothetical protein